jgi:uncharacterized protein
MTQETHDLKDEIEALDAFLMSDDSPEDCMMLCDLDGFLTGIAIGPQLIPPSEWLPIVWGNQEPAFKSAAQAQQVLGTIMKRYNQILDEVAARAINPIFMETPAGDIIASDWAEGFMQAVYLRPKSWDEVFDADKDYALIVPIMALCCDRDGKSLLGLDQKTEDHFFENGGDLVPAAALALSDYWKSKQRRPNQPSHQDKIGRNDPCRCGSGKKYKKCCGLN